MECCVCWSTIPTDHAVTFARTNGCHSSHILCVSCYTQVNGCPLCRFSPYNGPDYHGIYLLRYIRNQKYPTMDINAIKTDLNHLNKN
jgi:hypothetical protein